MTYIRYKNDQIQCPPYDKGVLDTLISDVNFIKSKLSSSGCVDSGSNSSCNGCQRKDKEIELLTEKINNQSYYKNNDNTDNTVKIAFFCFAALCLFLVVNTVIVTAVVRDD